MKKCLFCSASGLFLKLRDGLCPNCYNNFKQYETIYKELLARVTRKQGNKEELINELKLLSIELRRYDNYSKTIKSSDCNDLINILLSLECNSQDNKDSKSSINKPSTSTISNELKPIEKVIPNESIVSNHITKINPIEKNINSQIYSETSSIITTLTNSSLELKDLCYYSFLLKNTYMPVLKEYHINEVKNVNLSNLIDNCLNKASDILKLPADKIYSYYNYVAFSIETTGTNPKESEITKIAALKISYGKIQDKFYTSIDHSSSLKNSIDSFCKFIGNNFLVCHNSNFDYNFIKYNYEKIFNKPFLNNVECTLNLYKNKVKEFAEDTAKDLALSYCCKNILKEQDSKSINNTDSLVLSNSVNTFKLYEILKSK